MSQLMIFVGAHHIKSKDGFVDALEAEAGSLLWRYSLSDASPSYPVTDHTSVYFSASNGCIYALHRDEGALLWRQQVHLQFPSPPVITNRITLCQHRQYCFCFSGDRWLIAVATTRA